MQQEAGVSIDVVRIIQAMVLLFVAADAIVRWVFHVQGRRDDRDRGIGVDVVMSDVTASPIPDGLGGSLTGTEIIERALRPAFGRRQRSACCSA